MQMTARKAAKMMKAYVVCHDTVASNFVYVVIA